MIVVSTNPTHPKHLSITDLCAIATPPILYRSCSPREDPPMSLVFLTLGLCPQQFDMGLKSLKKKAGVSSHRRPCLI